MPTRTPTICLQLLQLYFPTRAARFPSRCSVIAARQSSNDASLPTKSITFFPSPTDQGAAKVLNSQALARLPTSSVLRSLFLGAFFSSSLLFTPGFALLKKVANSPSSIWNPDKNPLLRAVVKPLIYDQFCAGINRSEIQARIAQIKSLGFSGVILCYGKEIQVEKSNPQCQSVDLAATGGGDQELEWWKRGNLETLDMLGHGDYLGIKMTGCGKSITNDLLQGKAAPPSFTAAMDTIVQRAISQSCRIWIDSEQQAVQPTIDRWTIDLMRKHNRGGGQAVIYNTIQAYLKTARAKLEHQLQLAHAEGWTLAIKLVRGAYIDTDLRARIHDTKAATDAAYDAMVHDLLHGTGIRGVPTGPGFPSMQLFLAGHNAHSVARASALVRTLHARGTLRTLPEFGQLQGMADQLGCELLQEGEDAVVARASPGASAMPVPRVYKCLTWGSIRECMQYLVRRAVENRGATGAVKDGMPALARELRRRGVDALMGRRRRGRGRRMSG